MKNWFKKMIYLIANHMGSVTIQMQVLNAEDPQNPIPILKNTLSAKNLKLKTYKNCRIIFLSWTQILWDTRGTVHLKPERAMDEPPNVYRNPMNPCCVFILFYFILFFLYRILSFLFLFSFFFLFFTITVRTPILALEY